MNFMYRRAGPSDANRLGVLAMQVFLETYAARGVDDAIAHEAMQFYSPEAFHSRLVDPQVKITIAESSGSLVAFVDVSENSPCPIASATGPEVLRLYVHSHFKGQGLGRALLAEAEATALSAGARYIWLTAWAGNASALAFYPAVGYVDIGSTNIHISDRTYENRVFAKRLTTSAA